MIIRKDMCYPDEDCPVNDFAHTHDLPEAYDRGFGILKDEIDPAAPHDMASIRANIAKWRKSIRPDATGALREDNDMGGSCPLNGLIAPPTSSAIDYRSNQGHIPVVGPLRHSRRFF